MAERLPPEGQINGVGGALVVSSTDNPGPAKRQRRPSVRLGDIGGDQQTYDSHHANRRAKQQWRVPPLKDFGGKPSKTRPLMNLTGGSVGGGSSGDYHQTLDGCEEKEGNNNIINLDGGIGSWKVGDSSKSKRGAATKRVRSNWVSKVDELGVELEDKFEDIDVEDDVYRDRDFDREGLEQSPINSLDNNELGHGRDAGVRVSDGVELDGPSDTDARNWNNSDKNGVRVWLNQLGLLRYMPVFEIHEVDDEVLPLLTLEDLKDMGINAVGSRRKMYCSIQKLNKGFQ